jgi:hypothetical protein
MKYKVVLYNTLSSQSETDLAGNFTFYRLNDAIAAAQAWATIGGDFHSRLYDGTVWRLYT